MGMETGQRHSWHLMDGTRKDNVSRFVLHSFMMTLCGGIKHDAFFDKNKILYLFSYKTNLLSRMPRIS